jgi:hypothetical protein
MKKPFLIVAIALFSMAVSCSDHYGACAKAGAGIATGVSGGMKTVDQLRVSGLITPAEETNVLGYLKFVNDGDGAFLSCAQAAKTAGSKAGSFTACAQAFTTTINNPQELALIHVGNPNAEAQISLIVNGVTTGINSVITALGGK